jgi:hypothetical protein
LEDPFGPEQPSLWSDHCGQNKTVYLYSIGFNWQIVKPYSAKWLMTPSVCDATHKGSGSLFVGRLSGAALVDESTDTIAPDQLKKAA